ncbi:MAG: error-prone DNA polymerase, partial [Aeromicrobium erythreum]
GWVPLFQEQLMQMAIAIGDCTPDEADLLRRAMGSKRGLERIETLREKLFAGMARHGITGAEADAIYVRIQSFAELRLRREPRPELRAARCTRARGSSCTTRRRSAPRCWRNQPMGFYSPQSLVGDARRHGVETRRPDVTRSQVHADLEPLDGPAGECAPTGLASCVQREQPPVPRFDRGADHRLDDHRRDGRLAIRLGLTDVQGIGAEAAQRVVDARAERPFRDLPDVARRAGLTPAQMEALATAGAFDAFGISRRQAIWAAGHTDAPDLLEGTAVASPPPTLPGMSAVEETVADLWATSISPGGHPLEHLRPLLDREGVRSVGSLAGDRDSAGSGSPGWSRTG